MLQNEITNIMHDGFNWIEKCEWEKKEKSNEYKTYYY